MSPRRARLTPATRKNLRELFKNLGQVRNLTPSDQTKRAVRAQWGDCCPICLEQEKPAESLKLQIAHIESKAEGGAPHFDNLLPLCVRQKKTVFDADGDVDRVGCHHLYDNEGVWSRNQIAELRQGHPLARPEKSAVWPDDPIKRGLRVIDGRIARGHFKPAREEIRRLLGRADLSLEDEVEAHLAELRLLRRQGRETAGRAVRRKVDVIKGISCARSTPADIRDILEYELAMLYFQEREFQKAYLTLKRAEGRPARSPHRWLINEAQALVSAWECLSVLRTPPAAREPTVAQAIGLMNKIDTSSNESELSILKTWRVTIRLHIARMGAVDGCPDTRDSLSSAELIRNEQDFSTGWKEYTRTLLLHARGECLRAEGRHADAARALGLAGYRIVSDVYKNYEYLENVIQSLLAIRVSCPEAVPQGGGDLLTAAETELTRAILL